jgi:hypothetical protein
VLCLLPSVALESLGNLGITLAVGLARHSQVHTNLGALAYEVLLQACPNLLGATFGYAQGVLVGKLQCLVALNDFYKFLGAYFAKWAFLGCAIAFVDVTAYGATEFFHSRVVCLIS